MSEEVTIIKGSTKPERYQQLLEQLQVLIGEEKESISILSLSAGMIHEVFENLWTGFYIVNGDALFLGPYQGPLPCLKIPKGKGVCGTAWQQNTTIMVDNVDDFPGHIACSSLSKSEIVVPIRNTTNEVIAVLDIDSEEIGAFDQSDQIELERICKWISEQLH